jgi:hypothetical protein
MRTLALLWSGEPIRGKGHRAERRTAHRRLPLLLLAYLVLVVGNLVEGA